MKKLILVLVGLGLSLNAMASLNIKEKTSDIIAAHVLLEDAYNSYTGCLLEMNVDSVPANIFYKDHYSAKITRVLDWSYDLDSGYVAFRMSSDLISMENCTYGMLGYRFYVN